MAAGALASKGVGLIKKPPLGLQSTDIRAAALWGVAAGATAVWIVQPFDWIKKTFLEKPEPEEN